MDNAVVTLGEIVPPADHSICVTARPRPFSTQTIRRQVQAGSTIAELVEQVIPIELRKFAKVRLDGHDILQENWARIRPKPGRELTVSVAPAGGGGGSNPIRMVLQIAILALAVVLPYALFSSAFLATSAGAAWGAAVTAGTPPCGPIVLNQLQPPRGA